METCVTRYQRANGSEDIVCDDCHIWMYGILTKKPSTGVLKSMGTCEYHSDEEPLDPVY